MTDSNDKPNPETASESPAINHVALWAMITGIGGWVFYFTPTPLAIAAIVLGHIGLNQTKGTPGRNRAFAIAGLVLGYSGILLAILALMAALAIALPIIGMMFGGVIVP